MSQPKKEGENIVEMPTVGDSSSIERRKNSINYILKLYAVAGIAGLLGYTAYLNPKIFTLHAATLSVITETYNLIVLLLVPFFFGSVGAIARVLLSGMQTVKNIKLIFSSGLIATFSWLSIKSKIFIALITPYIVDSQVKGVTEASAALDKGNTEIYSLALVAVLVGMFASNIYIFIEQRVEQITAKSGDRA